MLIKLKVCFILVLTTLLISCGGTNTRSINDYDELREAMNDQTFEIQHMWALPMGGGMIDLTGNPNFIRFNKDIVDLFLPYFGVRHGGGGFNSAEGGITYRGPAVDLSITERSKRRFEIKFEGRQDQDQLRFIITVYPDGGVNTSVLMAQRQTISYRGNVRQLPEKLR